jgi:DME family drug/metabolite transporter
MKGSLNMQRKLSAPDGFWLVTGSAILWGTIGVATQAIYNATSSLFLNLARLLVATPVLLLACWRSVGRAAFRVRRRDFLIMCASGTLLSISHAGYFASIQYAGVTISTLLTMCISPLVVTCVSVLLKLETLTRRIVVALVGALVGAVLLVGLQSPDGAPDHLLLGAFYSVIAAVCYACAVVGNRFVAADYHPVQVTTINFSVGTLVLLAINLAAGFVPVQTGQGWLLVVYLGLVPTAFAYWMFQKGLRSVSATAASIISMLDPVVAALLAWLLFGETLAPSGVVGAGLLVLSIVLLSLEQPRTKAAQSAAPQG